MEQELKQRGDILDRNILVSMIDHAALKPDDTDEWVAKQ